MGWARRAVETLSLHGRPISRLQAFLQPGAKLLILTSNSDTIYQAAEMIIKRGFGRSYFSVLENLETADEKVTSFVANRCKDYSFGNFHTLAIGCLADEGAVILPRTPGLPDDAFAHDGQLTKREVRAITLSALLLNQMRCCGMWARAAAPSPLNGCAQRRGHGPLHSNATKGASP